MLVLSGTIQVKLSRQTADNEPHFGNMLLHLYWRSLEDRGKDAQLVMMYKMTNENVAII